MNWNELKEFIETLSEEQKKEEIMVIDEQADTACGVIGSFINDETFYCTFNGIIIQSDVDKFTPEELSELAEDTYLQIDEGIPYLIVQ